MGNKDIEVNDNTPTGKVKKKSLFKRICRFFAWFVGILVAIVLLLFCGIAWILTPERLTPMVEKIVGENITADFSLGKAELSVWGTFPRLQLDIDSLVIVNDVFDSLPPEELAKLPAYSDTLLKIGRFSGSVNIPALFIGKIRLTDVILGATAINIISYDRNKCNFNIFPERQPDNAESECVSLPDISIDRFRLVGDMPIRYVSIVDSVDVELRLLESDVMTECNSGYKLAVSSSLNAMLPPEINVDSINIGLDGRIDWTHDNPMDVRLNDFSINIGEIDSKFSAEIDFNEPSQVKSFVLSIAHVSPMEVLEMLPKQLKTSLEDIETDMAISSDVKLLMPYCIGDTSLPSVEVVIDVPRCSIRYGQYYIKELELNANATINGHDLNKSKLNVTRFHAGIDGADIDFEGSVTSVFNNFYADGKIRAVVELVDLPKAVKNEIAGSVSGNISLDAAARFYKNDLSLNGFHKIFLDGNLELRDIDVSLPELNMKFYTELTHFDLGTNNKFVSDASRIDSLLTASVKTDTLSFSSEGITLQGKNLRAGIGCSNKGLPKDTLTVIPLGATIYAKELSYNGDDTTIMRLRDIYAFTTLSRFNNDAQAPLFRFQAGMKRAFYADRLNRLLLNNGSLDLKAHLRPVGKVEKRLKERYDSIAKANPGLSQDSLIALYKKNFPRKMRNSSAEYMDFGLDNSTKRILMKWDVSGNINAEYGGLFTPYFPLRNRLSNFNVAFSMDSIVFKDVSYKVGYSDFLINGAIKNIRRALAFKFPLRAELHLSSDSLNVNELVQASYKGSAFAQQVIDGSVTMANVENAEELDSLANQATSIGEVAAILVPVNLNAEMTIDARNIVYSNMLMHNFNGELLVGNGAVNLRNLSASSKIGSAKLTALYSAPDKRNIRFGFGLLMKNIDVRQFIDMMPAVDSLMPLLSSFQGKINADIAATTDVDSTMNIVIPSLDAAVKLSGDSLVLLDAETFRTVSKWLLFKNKKDNVIPHMEVEMLIGDSKVELFPFVFDFDRYRLAVMGSNDLALNFKYHISVLKSPIPFKFGINMSGNPDKMKVRLGGAKYKPGKSGETIAIVDTARVNLLREIDNVFKSGARNARFGGLKIDNRPEKLDLDALNDTISRADSLLFIKEGLIEAPDTIRQQIIK